MTLTGATFLDSLETRVRICEAGRAAVGMGSTGAPERQDAYARRLFPEAEDARTRAAMADAMYSCALHALTCYREAMLTAPELHEPYSTHIGAAPAWLASIAQRMGAFVSLATKAQCDAYLDASPADKSGDVLVVSEPVHVIVLTSRRDPPVEAVDAYITSEGGSPEYDALRNEKGMCIRTRTMFLRRAGDGRIQTGSLDINGRLTWGRVALYAIDADKLRRDDE